MCWIKRVLMYPDLIEKKIYPVDCGIGYTHLPMDVYYSYHFISEAVDVLDRGLIRELDWWKQSVSRLIGVTSESIRFPRMRAEMKSIMDKSAQGYFVLSDFLKLLFKNWSAISKWIRSGNSRFIGEGSWYSRDELISEISLLNQKDGTKTEKDNRRRSLRAGHPGNLKVIDFPTPPAKVKLGSSSDPPKGLNVTSIARDEDTRDPTQQTPTQQMPNILPPSNFGAYLGTLLYQSHG